MISLEEARNKYSISIPDEEVFYSEQYKQYFSNKDNKTYDAELEKYRMFDEMYKKCFIVTFGEKKENDESYCGKRAIVLGGQTGAGKSRTSKIIQERSN